ncbi:MAG TPA: hypothetical protein VHW71_00255 [Steroidobacteraceae bacterium]|jgi:hypothetical protein|nr:hypothetical protein [Steroidobacteraceae bacterium]
MTNATVSAALAISLAAALPATAGDLQTSVTPRELVHCMMKRMKADRTQSYHAVFKACREDLAAAEAARGGGDTAMNSAHGAPDPEAAPKQ